MSNYTIAVPWSGKDALSDSDAAKVISGADFNTEFTAVQTALNTKADLNGSASETFSAVTASTGTNTTQVATTQFVTTAVSNNQAFPIGAVFTTVTVYANSAAVVAAIGGTTWVAFAAGKMLVGVDSGDGDFDTVGDTGGAKTHTLSVGEMPSHDHDFTQTAAISPAAGGTLGGGDSNLNTNITFDTSNTGGGAAHNNMPPYIAVYMWKRTA